MVKKLAKVKRVVATPAGKGNKGSLPNHLLEKKKKNFRIGGDIQYKRDLSRFVKWPRYVRIQRQKKIIFQRLSVPGAINQFTHTLERDQANKLFKLLSKYTPENKIEKRQRLKEEAKAKADGKEAAQGSKPLVAKFGLNHVTTLVENKQAQIVAIAHDVVPIELMIHLPALCRKMGVPYCFVKGKARLGKIVNQKTATCIALTEVKKEDEHDLKTLGQFFDATYNQNSGIRTVCGEPVFGIKNQNKRGRGKRRS
ncbi:unnamed protein product [Moneuplotes crassus]|uniref:60S ribosomal protein L7a n=2 Tax=Euplotes crassus TaxID=5936 RepID=A0AAD1XCQ7_EUPCR|nr:unnamed protein product [Moneuplotes crassus]